MASSITPRWPPRHGMYAAYLDWQADGCSTSRSMSSWGIARRPTTSRRRSRRRGRRDRGDPRSPQIPGADGPSVVDVRDVLAGRATVGARVLVVAQDDHVAPLSVADLLSGPGHEVVLTYAGRRAPLLGRYIVGGILGQLDAQGVRMRFMEVVAIRGSEVVVRNVYSLREETVGGFDSVVLACGSVSDSRCTTPSSRASARFTCSGTRIRRVASSSPPSRPTPWPSCSSIRAPFRQPPRIRRNHALKEGRTITAGASKIGQATARAEQFAAEGRTSSSSTSTRRTQDVGGITAAEAAPLRRSATCATW